MTHDPQNERLLELLADRTLFGLSPEEEVELQTALASSNVDPEELDRLAAELALSYVPEPIPGLPAHVRAAILAGPTTPARPAGPARGWFSLRLFAAMAACLLCAVGGWFFGQYKPEAPAAQLREAMVADAEAGRGDAVVVKWEATPDPAGAAASGDVVWSNTAQRGFMHFHKLAPNDPKKYQYQLWIFDAKRNDKYPVDGGVFDVPAGSDDVIVPITARLPVNQATLFAITVEPPGGVVVSNRERIPLLAKVPPGNAG
jgi:anti-sigma-K factor RskA